MTSTTQSKEPQVRTGALRDEGTEIDAVDITTLLVVASAMPQDGPYRYRYSPDMPNAPPFKFPENNPVPLPTSNTPNDGNTNYQYQYAPSDPVARPFQVPEDYTAADFVYTYKPRPGDSFNYNYVPVEGEFDFVFTPVQSDLNATPKQIQESAAAIAKTTKELSGLVGAVSAEQLQELAASLGGSSNVDLSGIARSIEVVGEIIEGSAQPAANVAAALASAPVPQAPVAPVPEAPAPGITTLLVVASAMPQDGPYRYRYSPDMPNAPPFKFPENNPVPLPTSNTPNDGNTNYQYQYAPSDPVARPFQVPEDYTAADFVYTYKPRPGDSFNYNYVPVEGEFDFVFTPVQSDLNATPKQIQESAAAIAKTTKELSGLVGAVSAEQLQELAASLGGSSNVDLSGIARSIEVVGEIIEGSAQPAANVAAALASAPVPQAPVAPVPEAPAPGVLSDPGQLGVYHCFLRPLTANKLRCQPTLNTPAK
eukprot:maker-scaffold84_size396325-snap-gene-0.17 protein:Tk09671 transcript:maker-scaffold84_size396325-snap-gene-0.17-mRNA-1 annotation:"microtubule-actin cross-linking factor isoforms 1 2 3 5"